MLNGIFKDTNLLEKGLNASWLRQEVTMNNIANNDTPGFKTSHVEFEDSLKSALNGYSIGTKRTRDKHIDMGDMSNGQARIVQDRDTSLRMDENNVDIESQMTEMARNSIYYTALTTKVTSQLGRLRTAITVGSK